MIQVSRTGAADYGPFWTFLLSGKPGCGKGHPLDTPVLTPAGWVPIGDLSVGDEIVGRDGKPTSVSGVFDRGVLDAFRVTFSDGASVVCDEDHIFTYQTHKLARQGSWSEITVGDLRKKDLLMDRPGRKPQPKYFIPLVEPVQHPEADLPVEPYLLGVLLANGALTCNTVTYSTNDQEIHDEVLFRNPHLDIVDATSPNSTAVRKRIRGFRDVLRQVGLLGKRSGDKFIPDQYLVASETQRRDLLAGLMDCDGSANGTRRKSAYYTTSPHLRDAVVSLVRSLGGVCTLSEDVREGESTLFKVGLSLNGNPFYLRRKANSHDWSGTARRGIVSIEPVDPIEIRCIKVEAPDELFVVDEYIVSHNTPFAVTGPDPFIVNVDAGLTSIAHLGIPKYPAEGKIDNSAQLEEIVEFLGQGPDAVAEQLGFPVRTVIIDTIDEVARILQRERKEFKRKDEMQAGDWDWLASQLNVFTRALAMMDYNVIFISHIKDVHDGETGATSYKLDISGAGAHQIPANVDVALFMDDTAVPLVEHTDEEDQYEQVSYVYAARLAKFEWIKDRTETLPAVMECDFETGFADIIDRLNSKAGEMVPQGQVEIEFEASSPAPTPAEPQLKPKPAAKSPDEVAEAMAAADQKLAAAKAARAPRAPEPTPDPEPVVAEEPAVKPGDVVKRTSVVADEDPSRSEDEASVNMTALGEGDVVTVESGLGFQFSKVDGAKPMQVMGARYVYVLRSGDKLLSRVRLPDPNVRPIPNREVDTGLFCQVTGVEISPSEANLSRLRVRKFLCESEYAKEIQQAKTNMRRS